MAKKKKIVHHSNKNKNSDGALMLLAAAAALVVGFFAIFAYKNQAVMPLPTATPNQIMTVNLGTENKSGEKGTATFQEVNGDVVVTLSMTGFPKGITQPTNINAGTCTFVGAIKYPLTSVVNGSSTTTLNVSLSDLEAMGPLAINIKKSIPQPNIFYSCGGF